MVTCYPRLLKTSMPEGGVPPKIVSEKLGRVNIGITLDTYSHAFLGSPERMAVVSSDLAKMGPASSIGRAADS